jgi:radical SAM superfamily enzyme YgiQ (UPF0313 family)
MDKSIKDKEKWTFLLVALNAKYIHSNPGIYSMSAYVSMKKPELASHVELSEYTINNSESSILADIYKRKPAVIGFSCYIWNIEHIMRIISEVHKLLPETDIWLGGPEVSYDAEALLKAHEEITGIMIGEGEHTFLELMNYYDNVFQRYLYEEFAVTNEKYSITLLQIPGIVLSGKAASTNAPVATPQGARMNLSELPFLYDNLAAFKNRIIYYETSRGCPFRCSYCLSSIDKQVRFRDIEIVKKELQFFLDNQVKQVKFVDRTFNCSHKQAMDIWTYIKEHDNGITNFHFEIAADILNEEELDLINTFRPGAVQMEIGVQSTNRETIAEIDRSMDIDKLKQIVARIHSGHNVHIHLDLIAGLPYEDYDSFKNSFNEVYDMKPEQLQLGFLKVLKGSKMHDKAVEYGINYTDTPPYEVLFTKWLPYDRVLRLKQIEEMVELYYNSNQFSTTLPFLVEMFATPFDLYEALADFYQENGYFIQTPSRMFRYEVLLNFVEKYAPERAELIKETLIVDLYLRENLKSRPEFAAEKQQDRDLARSFWRKEASEHHYLKGSEYADADSKALARMTHIEAIHYNLQTGAPLDVPQYMLFDYTWHNPLNHDARVYIVDMQA